MIIHHNNIVTDLKWVDSPPGLRRLPIFDDLDLFDSQITSRSCETSVYTHIIGIPTSWLRQKTKTKSKQPVDTPRNAYTTLSYEKHILYAYTHDSLRPNP